MPNKKEYIQGLIGTTGKLCYLMVMMEDIHEESYPIEPRLDTFLETNTGAKKFSEPETPGLRRTETKLEDIKTDLYTPHKEWCITCFDLVEITVLCKDYHPTYCIVGIEKCPTTGKEHYQGYFETEKPTRLIALKKLFKTSHFEPRKGTREQAIEYCKKEGNILYESGN